MNREYHKGYSRELHRDMELLIFGHAGIPLLVFPTSMGKFYQYEDEGMIAALKSKYERYLLNEVLPFIRLKNPSPQLVVTGCSFGGYHCVNFALRHPDLVSGCVSMGGAFDIHQFLNGYYDDDCYFNCPPDYLQNLRDDWYLSKYRTKIKMVLATGEHDICLNENLRLAGIMNGRSIPHWLDLWRNGTGHDWPWWRQMAQKFF